jgi:ABC-type sugar transport system permease subunit
MPNPEPRQPDEGTDRPPAPPGHRQRAYAARRRRRSAFASPQWLFLPALIFLALFWVAPLGPGLMISCEKPIPRTRSFEWAGLANYRALLSEATFRHNLLLSFYYLIGVVSLVTPIAYLVALVISGRSRALGAIRALFLIPWIVPPVVSALVFRSMADPDIGPLAALYQYISGNADLIPLQSGFWAMVNVILHSVWRSVPILTLFLVAGMTTISDELHEAAQVDGATPWQRFCTITFPLTRSHLATGLLLISAFTLQDAETIYAMTPGALRYGTEVAAVRLFREAFDYDRIHIAAAVGTFLLGAGVILMALYLTLFRRAEATT